MLSLEFGAATDIGAVREHNEDSMLADPTVFVVADGMGGHAAGEVASRLAVQAFGSLAGRQDLLPDDIVAGVQAANEAILSAGREQPQQAGMGTTVTGVALVQVGGADHWAIFNVGDSRVYRFLDGALTRLSVDHSEVEELLAAGHLTPDQARTYPRRNVVTRSLGSFPAPVPDVWLREPVPGERFLACSDGLTLEVDEALIAEVLGSERRPQEAAEALVELAVQSGGRDNVTVIVVDHVPAG